MTKHRGLRGLALMLALLFVVGIFPTSGVAASETAQYSEMSRDAFARADVLNLRQIFSGSDGLGISAGLEAGTTGSTYLWTLSTGNQTVLQQEGGNVTFLPITSLPSGQGTFTVTCSLGGSQLASDTISVTAISTGASAAIVGMDTLTISAQAAIDAAQAAGDLPADLADVSFEWTLYRQAFGSTTLTWESLPAPAVASNNLTWRHMATQPGVYRYGCKASWTNEGGGLEEVFLGSSDVRWGHALSVTNPTPIAGVVDPNNDLESKDLATSVTLSANATAGNATQLRYEWRSRRADGGYGPALSASEDGKTLVATQNEPGVYTYRCQVFSSTGGTVPQDEVTTEVVFYKQTVDAPDSIVWESQVDVKATVVPAPSTMAQRTEIKSTMTGATGDKPGQSDNDGATTWAINEKPNQDEGNVSKTYRMRSTVTYTKADGTTATAVVSDQLREIDFYYERGAITATPANGAGVGSDVTLSVSTSPDTELTYTWSEVGTSSTEGITNGNQRTCTVTSNVAGTHTYQCVVSKAALKEPLYTFTIDVNFYGMGLSTDIRQDNRNSIVLGDTVAITPDWGTTQPGGINYEWSQWRGNSSYDPAVDGPNGTGTGASSTNWNSVSNATYLGSTMNVTPATAGVYVYRCVARSRTSNAVIGTADIEISVYKLVLSSPSNSTGLEGSVGDKIGLELEVLNAPDAGTTAVGVYPAVDLVTANGTTYLWTCENDAGGTVEAESASSPVGIVSQPVSGRYDYKGTIVSGGLRLESRDSIQVVFYELLPEKQLAAGGQGLWNPGATVNLSATLTPSPATGEQVRYEWYADGEETLEGEGREWSAVRKPAGTYSYTCVATKTSSNGTITITSKPVQFTIFDFKATWAAEAVSGRSWTEAGDTITLKADSLVPADADIGGFKWLYSEDGTTFYDLPDSSLEGVVSNPTQTIAWPMAGRFQFKCELWATVNDQFVKVAEANATNADTSATSNVLTVYGLRFAEQANGVPVVVDYTGANTVVQLTAIAEPAPTQGGERYQYTWYVESGNTFVELEEGEQEDGSVVRIVTPTNGPGQSQLTVTGPNAGIYNYQCRARRVPDPGADFELRGTIEVDVFYNVALEMREEGLLAGQTVPVTAQVLVNGQPATNLNLSGITYTWTDGQDELISGPNTDRTGSIPVTGEEQTVKVVLRRGNGVIGRAERTFSSMYPVIISDIDGLGSDTGIGAAVGSKVVLLAKADPAPSDPRYSWQVWNGDEWVDVDDPLSERCAVDVTTLEPVRYRCLLGNGTNPAADNYVGVSEYTVSGYQLTIESSQEDPEASIKAGSQVRLTATIEPRPVGTPSYAWMMTNESVFEQELPGNAATILVSPTEGGAHTYTCSAELPSGGTVSGTYSLRVKQNKYTAEITTNPADTSSLPLNVPFTMTASILNKNPEDTIDGFQWQELPDNNGWRDSTRSDAQTDTMTFLPNEEGTWYYRCMVTLYDHEEDESIEAYSKMVKVVVTESGASVDVDPNRPWNGGSSSSSNGNSDFPLTSGAPFRISATQPYRVQGIHAAKQGVGVTAEQVLACFVVREADGTRVRMIDKNGKVKSPTDLVCTGDVVELIGPNNNVKNSATVVVSGDVLGTGTMSLSQLVKMAKAMKDNSLTDCYLEAGDWDGSGSIGLSDLVVQAKELKQ